MPRCEIALDGNPLISLPSNRMRPLVGRSTPVKQLKNVLLPAPLGPIIARTSLRATSKLTSDSAAKPPKRTDSCSVLRIGVETAPRLLAGEPLSAESSASTLRRERAGRWDDCLVAWHRLFQMIGTAAHLEDEFLRECLVVGLAQHLVSLREVVA